MTADVKAILVLAAIVFVVLVVYPLCVIASHYLVLAWHLIRYQASRRKTQRATAALFAKYAEQDRARDLRRQQTHDLIGDGLVDAIHQRWDPSDARGPRRTRRKWGA